MNSTKKSYIICATPRSGSTLLCDLLTDTGVAGRPDSFFLFDTFDWPQYFNVSTASWNDKYDFDQSYLSAVLDYGTNGTSVFGMRLMWDNLNDLSKRLDSFYPALPSDSARFAAAFENPVYLYLSRKDKVAQAVSHLKAEQTGLWHVFANGEERERLKPGLPPTYDFKQLLNLVDQAEQADALWKTWFVKQQIEPIRLSYEILCEQPQLIVGSILSRLDLAGERANRLTPKTAKLADNESDQWIARFKAELARYRRT